MDDIDRKIIDLLSADSRRSLADIGNAVNLAPSSVNERIRRLTAAGTIKRFTMEVDPVAVGLPTLIFLSVALRDDADEGTFRRFVETHPMVLECHHVTGAWSYLLKLRVREISEIEGFLEELKAKRMLGQSETIIALSSPVAGPFVQKELD